MPKCEMISRLNWFEIAHEITYRKSMKMENLRTLHQARPFRPFAIHTADGGKFPIPHSEFLAYDPEGTMVVALRTNHTVSILDLDLITELEILPSNGKTKRRARK